MTKQVLKELDEIQHFCHNHYEGKCDKCLFCLSTGCFFNTWPDEWDIKALILKVKEREKNEKEKAI